MLRIFFYVLVNSLFFSSTAYACSCNCPYDQTVSELLEDKKVVWGVPIESRLSRDTNQSNRIIYDKVITRVQVIEGYGLVENKSEFTAISSPDDGASCGLQLSVGVPQLITTSHEQNILSNCTCTPPITSLLNYLKEGKDAFIPNLDDCEKPGRSSEMDEKCKVWDPSWAVENEERGRINNIFRGIKPE